MPSSRSSLSSSSSSTITKQQLRAAAKAAREHIAAQALKTRVRGIFSAQRNRAKKAGQTLDYLADDLHALVLEQLATGSCPYCMNGITPKGFTIDHRVPIARGGSFKFENLAVCCRPCNYQKGQLSQREFMELLNFIWSLDVKAGEDIKRRLTVGGRWSPK